MAKGIDIPKRGEWPGTIESFKIVRDYVKPRIWDFITIIGIGVAIALFIEIIVVAIFKRTLTATLIDDVAGFIIGAFLQLTVIAMYYRTLQEQDFTISAVLLYGYKRLLKMLGLLIVMDVVLVASVLLLLIPFFFVLPRIYLAPFYLVKNDSSVNQAIAAAWHSTRHNAKLVWGILLMNIAIALLVLTIVGIPLAIYWGLINSASFAFITLYLSQPNKITS
ncbi:MAG: hypothetical protein ACYCPS_03500 [Candidatus Saccharimonadales bacterium]